MSRRDTISQESYRVRVLRDGVTVGEWLFDTNEEARERYAKVNVPQARKDLQQRAAGAARYRTIETTIMEGVP